MRHRQVLACALFLAACARHEEQRTSAPAGIGAQCIDCHGEIVRTYRATGMARATGPVEPRELAGLGSASDGSWTYSFDASGPGASLVEHGRAGEKLVAPLAFAIGAGLLDRSFAARLGELQWFAPLEVVTTANGRVAALSPGHSMRAGTRFTIPIAEECLACHTDRLPPREYPLNLPPAAGTWSPEGISCAACHGDVEAHVVHRESGSAGDPVVVPGRAGADGRTDPIESLSLCARCHLQGDASFLLDPGARGIAPIARDLLERRAVFVTAKPDDEIGFVSQVERLVLSRCFTESLAAGSTPMTCTTCHDPHRSSFDPKERAAVRARCDVCHPARKDCALAPERRSNRDCVECHMRKTPVFDVATVEIHDHRIRKEPAAPTRVASLRTKESKDGRLALFAWPGRPPPAYADDPGLWMMAFTSLGRRDLARPLLELEPRASAKLATYHHMRGTLLEDASRLDEARAAYIRALALDPAQAESAVNFGALLGRLDRVEDGIALLDKVLDEHPKAEGALRNRAVLKLSLGDRSGFAADLEAAYAIAPQPSVARALAQYHAQAGRKAVSEAWSERERTLAPN